MLDLLYESFCNAYFHYENTYYHWKKDIVTARKCASPTLEESDEAISMKKKLIQITTANQVIAYSPAKLNLFLKVINKRDDGYHTIQSLFERVNLFDTLILEKISENKIIIEGDGPSGKDNLVYKSLELLKKTHSFSGGVKVFLKKKIPIGAGLGGGSSNAASSLLAYCKLYGHMLSRDELCSLGMQVGADVSFFLYEYSHAWVQGIGEKIEKISLEKTANHVVVFPNIHISTEKVYKQWERVKSMLTEEVFDAKLIKKYFEKIFTCSLKVNIRNDLFDVAKTLYPELEEIQNFLFDVSSSKFFLTGSGSAYYSIHSQAQEAKKVYDLVKKNTSYAVFLVQTL